MRTDYVPPSFIALIAISQFVLGSLDIRILSAQGNYTCVDETSGKCLTVPVNNRGWIVGEIRPFAFGGDAGSKIVRELHNAGWLECEGQSLDVTDFKDLYRAIGTTWGSKDKGQSFLVPDLRSAFLRGWTHTGSQKNPDGTVRDPQLADPGALQRIPPRPDAGPGQIPGNSGDAVGSIQADLIRNHAHSLFPYRDWHIKSLPGDGVDVPLKIDAPANVVVTQSSVLNQEGPGAETRPKNAYLMYFIYVGKDVSNVDPVSGKGPTVKP